jgi:hypothetical protein
MSAAMVQVLHPTAKALLDHFAASQFFRSDPLCAALAERDPLRCLRWAVGLVEHRVRLSSPPDLIAQTLSAIQRAIGSISPDHLPELDDLAWRSWSSDSFDAALPYLQRAVARLGWATMCLIRRSTGSAFSSQYTGLQFPNGETELRELVAQCAMALDISYTDTLDGRMLVAFTFSREMAALS